MATRANAVFMSAGPARTVRSRASARRPLGNRRIQISFQLLEYRRRARENLTSERGQALRKQRSVEVETVFRHIKHNMRFHRFQLRGLEKVKIEWGLVCIDCP